MPNENGSGSTSSESKYKKGIVREYCDDVQHKLGHTPILLVSGLMFLFFCAAGFSITSIIAKSKHEDLRMEALDLAKDTGEWFSERLLTAMPAVFSLAQFATNLDEFKDLPDNIGPLGGPGSLPQGEKVGRRNISGVCDQTELLKKFEHIAKGVKESSQLGDTLVNLQLAPEGVVCLLYPKNNTEDFEDGKYLDSTGALGLDLFHDPNMKYIATRSINGTEVGIAGPITLVQCPDCGLFFIIRLPIVYDMHDIAVDEQVFPNRWGFATALVDWTKLEKQAQISESFDGTDFKFKLERTDFTQNDAGEFVPTIIPLASSEDYEDDKRNFRYVEVNLDTTQNGWVMTVAYDYTEINHWIAIVASACMVISSLISYLVYVVLTQKQVHADMLADTLAQEAKVATERNMTAYFAHELRNPLSALDSALRTLAAETTETWPSESTKELMDGMQLSSSFMSSIMNNLLDVRKIEEGKMDVRSANMSLASLVDDSHRMMVASVRDSVEFTTSKMLPPGKEYVMGDFHRIQQVLTNVVSNAVKYTLRGSIVLAVSWVDDMVCLECIDTGPGIPKSEQAKLFERFVQRGGAPGTGLGLNIAKEIVHMMGGSICFISDPTVKPGTTCRIKLPLKLSEQPTEDDDGGANKKKKANVKVSPLDDEITVLIIDDIKMNRTMLSRRITKAIAPNAQIFMAETGEEALDMCRTQYFDIIICDQYMEEAGGVLVGTDVIIAMRRDKINSFIVGCSGNDLDDKFLEAGANLVWGKPMPSNAEIITQWKLGIKNKNTFFSTRETASHHII